MRAFGQDAMRLSVLTPSSLSLPDLTCGPADNALSNITWQTPPMVSISAGPLPLYGTCVMSSLVIEANSSPARCDGEPVPIEQKFVLFLLSLLYATNASTVAYGALAGAAINSGSTAD